MIMLLMLLLMLLMLLWLLFLFIYIYIYIYPHSYIYIYTAELLHLQADLKAKADSKDGELEVRNAELRESIAALEYELWSTMMELKHVEGAKALKEHADAQASMNILAGKSMSGDG